MTFPQQYDKGLSGCQQTLDQQALGMGYGMTTQVHIQSKLKNDIWLHSRNFDIFYFQVIGLFCLLLIIPYKIFGDSAILPIYNFYLIFFGMPHNYLTWQIIFPKNVRQTYNFSIIKQTAIVCFLLCLILPFEKDSDLSNWILSLITYSSLWHAYRQHHGICKIYDVIQSKKNADTSIFKDRHIINVAFGLSLGGVVIWAFTHPKILFLLSADDLYHLIYPRLSMSFFYVYTLFTIILTIYGLKRCIWDRIVNHKFVPWPQLGLMLMAFLTFVGPYFFIPIQALPVAVAIGTIFHNIQYFVFVWIFEKNRSMELMKQMPGTKLTKSQNWTTKGAAFKYFGTALGFSAVVIFLYLILPRSIAMVFIYFLAFAHYLIDGHIWKSHHNSMLTSTLHRMAQQ